MLALQSEKRWFKLGYGVQFLICPLRGTAAIPNDPFQWAERVLQTQLPTRNRDGRSDHLADATKGWQPAIGAISAGLRPVRCLGLECRDYLSGDLASIPSKPACRVRGLIYSHQVNVIEV